MPREIVAVMRKLVNKVKRDDGLKGYWMPATASDSTWRVAVRDRLLVKEEGYYQDRKFQFETEVPIACNVVPPKVRCLTRICHPNITETGKICLSLLREHDGWGSHKDTKGCCLGIKLLFTDLLNFNDPLNIEAVDIT